MENPITWITQAFTGLYHFYNEGSTSDKKHIKKGTYTLLIFVLVLSSDYFLGISESFIINRKIEQINKIERLINSNKISHESINQLLIMKNEVVTHKGFWSFLSDLISEYSNPMRLATKYDKIDNNIVPIVEYDLVHKITSAWYIFLIMLFIVVLAFWTNSFRNSQTLFSILLIEVILWFVASTFAYIFSFIPIIYTPAINYLINCLLCPFLITIIAYSIGYAISWIQKVFKEEFKLEFTENGIKPI